MYLQTLSCVLIASIFLIQLFKIFTKPPKISLNLPPGPRGLPIIGNLHQIGILPHISLLNLSKKLGPVIYLKLGEIPTLVISSSDIAKEIYHSHDITFSGRPRLCAVKTLSYNFVDVVFSPYGEYWRMVRKICMLELLSTKRVRSFRALRQDAVNNMLEKIDSSVNLSKLTLELSNEVTCRAIFGYEYSDKVGDVLEETQMLIGGFCIADFFPRLEWVNAVTGYKRKVRENFERLDRIYSHEIERQSKRMMEDDGEGDSLVRVLLRVQKEQSHGNVLASVDNIKGILTDMFIAGTDTSSSTVVWTMTELIRNPTVMAKVQQEVDSVVGDKKLVEEDDLDKLEYLKLVIKETLRLRLNVPLLVPRETIEPCRVGGYDVPAGTRVFFNAYAMARDETKWERPEEFIPERFLENGRDFRGLDFEFVPFGFGRRGCPGMNFGVVVVELAVANLVRRFEWRLPEGVKELDVEENFGLTTHKKNALCLVAESRM